MNKGFKEFDYWPEREHIRDMLEKEFTKQGFTLTKTNKEHEIRLRKIASKNDDALSIKSIIKVFKSMGVEVEIDFNNRNFFIGTIFCIFGSIREEILKKSCILINKIEEMSENKYIKEFEKVGVKDFKAIFLKTVLKFDYERLKNFLIKFKSQYIEDGIEEMNRLYKALEGIEYGQECLRYSPYLTKDILKCTTVWEIFIKGKKIGRGGRSVSTVKDKRKSVVVISLHETD